MGGLRLDHKMYKLDYYGKIICSQRLCDGMSTAGRSDDSDVMNDVLRVGALNPDD